LAIHSAKLIWITPNAEAMMGKIARVSNPKNEDNPDVTKLLKYCIKHGHWSVFEMASMCVEIHTTRAIRSWLHYVDLRGDNGTQREHMSIARSIGEILDTQLPNVARAMWG
jgi:thymidylate synthase ThyX